MQAAPAFPCAYTRKLKALDLLIKKIQKFIFTDQEEIAVVT